MDSSMGMELNRGDQFRTIMRMHRLLLAKWPQAKYTVQVLPGFQCFVCIMQHMPWIIDIGVDQIILQA